MTVSSYNAYVFGQCYVNQTYGVYLHGFSNKSAVSYSVRSVPWGNQPGARASVTLTVGEVAQHVDGSLARVADVHVNWREGLGTAWTGVMLDVIEGSV